MAPTKPSRRGVLSTLGAVGIIALAGCGGSDDAATPTGPSTDEPARTTAETGTDAPTGTTAGTDAPTETATETGTGTVTENGTPGETPSAEEYLQDATVISIEDRKDAGSVTVDVGVEPDQQAFDPTLLTITPGTTVTWEWTGEGGSHNVVAEDATFVHAETVIEAGHTFEHTFEEAGNWPYHCEPHEINGMRGYIVVEQ